MVSAIIVALSPFLTSALTGWVKGWTPFATLTDAARTPVIRFLAALIALLYVVAGMWLTGSLSPNVLADAVNAFIFALLAWLGSLGVFHAFFQKAVAPAASAA